jgi:hypothetical protein
MRSSILKHYSNVVCRRCGKAIKVGDKVLTNNNGSGSKLYHFDCWESLFIDV